MSIISEYFFPSSDGKTLIHVNQWTPVGRDILGVVQIAHGVAEYVLPAPIPRERAMEAALEHYGYCADIVDQIFETVGALADGLPQSTVWYFWWD